MGAELAIGLLLQLLDRSAAIGGLIARFQGGQITKEQLNAEIDKLVAEDDVVRSLQVAAIAKAKAEGR